MMGANYKTTGIPFMMAYSSPPPELQVHLFLHQIDTWGNRGELSSSEKLAVVDTPPGV